MGNSPSPPPPLQPRPVALRFPCVRATKKSTEGTPVHRQRWGPRNRWRMVPHATQGFLCWRYPSSRGPMGHLFQPTRRLCVDSMCYTDTVYIPLFNLWYIDAFKLNKHLHKFISPTFTWACLIISITLTFGVVYMGKEVAFYANLINVVVFRNALPAQIKTYFVTFS